MTRMTKEITYTRRRHHWTKAGTVIRAVVALAVILLTASGLTLAQGTFPGYGKDYFPTTAPFAVNINGVLYLANPIVDLNTVVGRSGVTTEGTEGAEPVPTLPECPVCKTTVADSDIPCFPVLPPPPPPRRELHTEMLSLNMCGPSSVPANFTVCYLAGQPAFDTLVGTVPGASNYFNSFGEVESMDGTGDPINDFPATSFWDMRGVVYITPPPGGTSGRFYTLDPILMSFGTVTTLPPIDASYTNLQGTVFEGGVGPSCGLLPVPLYDAVGGALVGQILTGVEHDVEKPVIDSISASQGLTFVWYQDDEMMNVEWHYAYQTNGDALPSVDSHIGKLDFRAAHPECDELDVKFNFFRPDGQTGWRQTVFSLSGGGVSDVYAVGDHPGVWHIPDVAGPLDGSCGDTIFTAVDLVVYGASNPDGFGDLGRSVGSTLDDLGVSIVNGQVEGLEGIYWATSEWEYDPPGRSIFKPIGGIQTLLNSADCSGGLEVIAEHIGGILVSGSGCCAGTRGNVDGDADDGVNIADLTYLVNYLFSGGGPPPCWDEADIDGDSSIGVADITFLVDFLFGDSPPLPSCS